MNEYMKQQTSQMTNLMDTFKKINPPSNINNQTGSSGANYMQQQRVCLESLSKKHKLDDDVSEVFQTPTLHPFGTRVAQTIHPSGRVANPTQPTIRPPGISPLPRVTARQAPTYADAMMAATQKDIQPGHNQRQFRPRPRPRPINFTLWTI